MNKFFTEKRTYVFSNIECKETCHIFSYKLKNIKYVIADKKFKYMNKFQYIN